MSYFLIRPAVAGGLGERTELDHTVVPFRIIRLHYAFDDCFGDWLVTTHPVFLLLRPVAEELRDSGATGFALRPVDVTKTDVYDELHPDAAALPDFAWLDVHRRAGTDDVGLTPAGHLVLSEPVHARLQPGLVDASIDAYS